MLTNIHPALVLLFLAKWVHRDISTGNIIVVEDDKGCVCGFLSDLEYAKAMSNESLSSDPKTVCFDVKDRSCLTFDQGTPYFIPLEIHAGKRHPEFYGNPSPRSFEELEQDFDNVPLNLPVVILRYNHYHDLESLMWVALWIVFGRVNWEAAKKIWPKIFMNSASPSDMRREFFITLGSPSRASFIDAFHPELLPVFPRGFEMIRKEIWCICMVSEPKERDYHKCFNSLIFAFDRLLLAVDGKADVVPLVV